MPAKISERLLGLWNRNPSTITSATEESFSAQEHFAAEPGQDSSTDEKHRVLQSLLSPVYRNNTCAVLGLVRLSSWNLHSQTSFADFCAKVATNEQRKVLAISPWTTSAPILNQRKRSSAATTSDQIHQAVSRVDSETEMGEHSGGSKDYFYISLEAAADRVEPSVISQLLRDLSLWKKTYDIVLLDLGIVGQPVSQSLANWCDAIYLISNEADQKRYATAGRQIDHWTNSGFRLDAAIHVA
jgi:hypothetical protein